MLPFDQYVRNLFKNTKIRSVVDIGTTDIVSVSSTCLSEVRYDLATQVLSVEFKESGATYDYLGVPEAVYQDIVNAGSVGQEYNFLVKGNYFYIRT